LPHPPQLVIDERELSHPSVSGGVLLQSVHPAAQAVYVHVPPEQASPRLCVVSQEVPHTLHVVPVVCVSHPLVSGAVVMQSAQPMAHPEYTQLVPLQPAPVLWAVSHAAPHAPQLTVLLSDVSHPFRLGAAASQSP
jgi:hypothetical protein